MEKHAAQRFAITSILSVLFLATLASAITRQQAGTAEKLVLTTEMASAVQEARKMMNSISLVLKSDPACLSNLGRSAAFQNQILSRLSDLPKKDREQIEEIFRVDRIVFLDRFGETRQTNLVKVLADVSTKGAKARNAPDPVMELLQKIGAFGPAGAMAVSPSFENSQVWLTSSAEFITGKSTDPELSRTSFDLSGGMNVPVFKKGENRGVARTSFSLREGSFLSLNIGFRAPLGGKQTPGNLDGDFAFYRNQEGRLTLSSLTLAYNVFNLEGKSIGMRDAQLRFSADNNNHIYLSGFSTSWALKDGKQIQTTYVRQKDGLYHLEEFSVAFRDQRFILPPDEGSPQKSLSWVSEAGIRFGNINGRWQVSQVTVTVDSESKKSSARS
ncbi:MAG TPA: hypothetical protein VI874_05675, partial [Candidatus Norongarragalinales archaeon]|nr:hypothetical protein [Candidatus Norongarragalinales archaeon]